MRKYFPAALIPLGLLLFACMLNGGGGNANESGHWSVQKTSSAGKLLVGKVQFVDSRTGWTFGYSSTDSSGSLMKTTDGGATWLPQPLHITSALYAFQFLNANLGWAVGDSGPILKTTDGGATWTSQASGFTTSQPPNVKSVEFFSIHFIDTNNGWLVGTDAGGDGVIYKTTDGGELWTVESYLPTEVQSPSIEFADARHGWVVGDNVMKTSDGGSIWKTIDPPDVQEGSAIDFVDSSYGWLVGGEGSIFKTTNGGATWLKQTSGTTAWLYSVYFADSNEGWAAGSSNTILHTSNGGSSWTTQYVDSTCGSCSFNSLSFLNANLGWALGLGTLLKYTRD